MDSKIGQLIVNEQIVSDTGSFDFKHDKNGLYSRFGRSSDGHPYVRAGSDSTHYLELILQGFKKPISKTHNGDNITFHLKAGLDIKHTIRRNKVKEDIILTTPQGTNELRFEFDLVGVTHLKVGNIIEFYDDIETGKLLFKVEKPVVSDATGDAIDVDMSVGGGIITLTVNQIWLDNATYPVIIDPTVSTSTSIDAIWSTTGENIAYANGYYWAAYYNGTEPVIRSSTDASTWGSENSIFADWASNSADTVFGWCIRYEPANNRAVGYYRRTDSDPAYRHLALGSGGGITYFPTSSDEHDNQFGHNYHSCLIDDKARSWVLIMNNAGNASIHRRNNLTGSTDYMNDEDVTDIGAGASGGNGTIFRADGLGDTGDVYFITWGPNSNGIYGLFYDDSTTTFDSTWTQIETDGGGANGELHFSGALTDDGLIHLVFKTDNGELQHITVDPTDHSTVDIDTDITGGTTGIIPTLSTDGTNLWLFYSKGDEKIYWSKWDTSSWGSENTLKSGTDAIVGAIDSYGISGNDQIGVIWTQGSGSPYDVVFDTISVAVAETITADKWHPETQRPFIEKPEVVNYS